MVCGLHDLGVEVEYENMFTDTNGEVKIDAGIGSLFSCQVYYQDGQKYRIERIYTATDADINPNDITVQKDMKLIVVVTEE